MPHGIDALLIDVEGVLVSGGHVLPGALEATVRLRAAGIPFRLLTNITRLSSAGIARELERLGFSIDADEVWNPPRLAAHALRRAAARAPAAWLPAEVLAEELPGVRPLLVEAGEDALPDLVLLGDSGAAWSEAAARRLAAALDAGADIWRLARRPEPAVLGLPASELAALPAGPADAWLAKPAPGVFQRAVSDLGLPEGAVVAMVGDDLDVDVAGAHAAGLVGVLVLGGRTTTDELEGALASDGPSRPDRHASDLGAFVHGWLKIR